MVPLERNGQKVNLLQRKFHVSIPLLYGVSLLARCSCSVAWTTCSTERVLDAHTLHVSIPLLYGVSLLLTAGFM